MVADTRTERLPAQTFYVRFLLLLVVIDYNFINFVRGGWLA